MAITKAEAERIYMLARALEDTGRICSLSDADGKAEWRSRNQEAQCALKDALGLLQEPSPISMAREYYEIYQVRKYNFDPLLLGTFSTMQQAEKAMDAWRADMPNQKLRIEKVTRCVVSEYAPKPRDGLVTDGVGIEKVNP